MGRKPVGGLVSSIAMVFGCATLLGLQSAKHQITLGILLSGAPKEARPAQVMVLEDGVATVTIPDVGQFAFSPSFRKDGDKVMVVTIWDASVKPNRELGQVEVPVGGKGVQSKTKPSFEIQVLRVTPLK